MKKIPLTQGKYAIVDDDDYDFLIQWKWFAHKRNGIFYAARTERFPPCPKPKTISMHRVINKPPSGFITDHINKNGLDNRKKNLRTATVAQNQYNRSAARNSSSKYKGVSKHKRHSKYAARININGEQIVIGYFHDEKKAAEAYMAFAKGVHGEFYKGDVL